MNTKRTPGRALALATLLLDAGKGAAALLIARHLFDSELAGAVAGGAYPAIEAAMAAMSRAASEGLRLAADAATARAAAWCDAPENRAELAALLAGTLALPAALVNGALGHLSFAAGGRPTQADGVRLLSDMARAGQVDGIDAAAAAARVFRPDLFDAAVSGPIA